MPITQARLLRLLEAGEQFQTMFGIIAETLATKNAQANDGKLTHREALAELVMEITAMPQRGASLVLNEERVKWRLTHKKNASTKEHMAAGRTATQTAVGLAHSSRRQSTHSLNNPGLPAASGRTAQQIAQQLEQEEQELSGDTMEESYALTAVPTLSHVLRTLPRAIASSPAEHRQSLQYIVDQYNEVNGTQEAIPPDILQKLQNEANKQ